MAHEEKSEAEITTERYAQRKRLLEAFETNLMDLLTDRAADELGELLAAWQKKLGYVPTGFMVYYYPYPDNGWALTGNQSFGYHYIVNDFADWDDEIELDIESGYGEVSLEAYRDTLGDIRWMDQPMMTLLPEDIRPDYLATLAPNSDT